MEDPCENEITVQVVQASEYCRWVRELDDNMPVRASAGCIVNRRKGEGSEWQF